MRVNRVDRATGSKKNPWKDTACMKCGRTIAKGDPYQWAKGFHGPKKVICGSCHFTRADLTNSKLSQVYEAFDAAYTELDSADAGTDLQEVLDSITEAVREVESEYREAAEAFNDGGPNAEKADECDSCASELESVDVPELHSYEDWLENEHPGEVDLEEDYNEWVTEQIEEFRSNIESADSL